MYFFTPLTNPKKPSQPYGYYKRDMGKPRGGKPVQEQ
jgi:hypothetical protein